MDLGFLSFLSEPWFVLTWYGLSVPSAIWVLYDGYTANRHLNKAMKWAWPILILFFSVVGLALYIWSSRPPRIGQIKNDEANKKAFHDYVQSPFSKLTGTVAHCVGGGGLGIITAMAVARLLDVSFWEEFWLMFLAGYVLSWLIFQYIAMRRMTDSRLMALWMGGRAEIFTMLTAMTGMGLFMGYVTPTVVGQQPDPSTYAFWGFAAFGLLAAFVVSYPMAWILIRMGWKHGMG